MIYLKIFIIYYVFIKNTCYICITNKYKPLFFMKYISLPIEENRNLSFYLAMEEFVARYMKEYKECFFMWQVLPSVIFGRNQLVQNEVNVEFCKQNHIKMYRRKSGGGCVYSDMNNIMFSYIASADSIGFTFYKYINLIVDMLRKLGIDAHGNARNDILVDNKKVSGNAFYHIPGRCIVHGTMLYDTNMKNMLGAITPNNQKLISKGVKSIRQRIALLKDYTTLDITQFKKFAKDNLCDDTFTLSINDLQTITEIEKGYLSDDFIYGKNPKYTIVKKRYFEGVGEIQATMEIKNDIINSLNLMGDFFILCDIDSIIDNIKGRKLNYESLKNAIPDNLSHIILNLNKNDFLNFLIN